MSRLFALGLDGVGPGVWLRLRERGWLPRLGTRIGSISHLESTVPPLTAPAWTSIATGLNPGRHGVLDFWTRPTDGQPRALIGNSTSRTFWECASEQGFGVGVFNYPLSYPPRPVRGFWVSGMNTPRGATDFAFPNSLGNILRSFEPDMATDQATIGTLRSSVERRIKLLHELTSLQLNHLKAGLQVLHLVRPQELSLFVFALTSTDRFLHFFWDCVSADEAKVPKALLAAAKMFWLALDEGVDSWIRSAATDEVLLFSDHGFGKYPKQVLNVPVWLRNVDWHKGTARLPRRIVLLKVLGILKNTAKRILPPAVWRQLQSARVATNDRYVRIEALYGPVLGVYGRTAEANMLQIANSIVANSLDEFGQPLFVWARTREEVWPGAPQSFPEIVFCLRDDLGAGFGSADPRMIFPSRSERIGDHAFEGIIGFDTPVSIAAQPNLRVWDVAPIALQRIGAGIPADLDGKVPDFLPGERLYVEKTGNTTSMAGRYTTEQREELAARLEILGYLD